MTARCSRELTVGGGHGGGQLGWVHVGLGAATSRRGPRQLAGRRGRAVAAVTAPTSSSTSIGRRGRSGLDATGQPMRRTRRMTAADPASPLGLPPIRRAGGAARAAAGAVRRTGRGAPGADAASRLRPSRRLRRPRAQRRHVVPDRVRPAVRGGDPGRRAGRRPGDPRRQRVLGHGRRRAAPDAAAPPQDLSLPSQPRDRSRPLAEILADEGVGTGDRVGVVGWKTFADPATIEVPAFLVDALRALVGPGAVSRTRATSSSTRRTGCG